MKDFKFGVEYFLTTNTEINEYLDFVINDDKNKQIKYIFSNDSSKNGHMIDSEIFIVFDNDAVLRINYNFYSLMYAKYMWIQNLNIKEKELNNDDFKLELDVTNARIVGFEIEKFSEEYEINPSSGTSRPNGGDYFKQITFELSNGNNLCICAEDSEVDGYCNIWEENRIIKIEKKMFNNDGTANADIIREWAINHVNKKTGEEKNGLIPFNVQQFNEFSLAYHHDLMSSAGLWGFMDKEGKVIVEPKYLFEPMEYDGLYIVCEGTGWRHTPDLPEGKIWSEVQKWGVIDKNQNVIIPAEYDQIDFLYNDTEEDENIYGSLFTVFRHQYKPYEIQEVALFNARGEQIIPFIYNDFSWSYCDGQLIVYKEEDRDGDYPNRNGHAGIYDLKLGKEIIAPNKYREMDYISHNLFIISDDRDNLTNATIINANEEVIGKEKVWDLVFRNTNAGIYKYKGKTMDGKYYYFNIKDNKLVDMLEIDDNEWSKM